MFDKRKELQASESVTLKLFFSRQADTLSCLFIVGIIIPPKQYFYKYFKQFGEIGLGSVIHMIVKMKKNMYFFPFSSLPIQI